MEKPMVQIIAHRGASKYVPENTLEAFQKAHELGCQFIECDIALTKDLIPILMHDDTLNRTTNGKGRVDEYSSDFIQNLDAGSWMNAQLSHLRIPTFKDALSWHASTKGWFNFEIKSVDLDKVEIAVSSILNVFHQASYTQHIVFSSFQYEIMKALNQKESNIDKAYLSSEANDDVLEKALETGCYQLNVSKLWVTEHFIEKAHQRGLKVGVYTVNDVKDFNRLKSWGVDAVFTDDLKAIKSPMLVD